MLNLVYSACGCSAAGLAQRYKLSHDDMTYNDTLVYMYRSVDFSYFSL